MEKKDKTLVILTPAFPGNESETYWVPSQQLLVKALHNNFPGVKIIVLSLQYPDHRSSYTWHGITVFSFDGMHRRKLKRLSLWQNIRHTVKDIHSTHTIIGLFSCWCGECALIGKYLARKYTLRHYIWICGQDARKTNRWISFIRPRGDELVAMSPSLVREFQKNHGKKPLHIIPNAIDRESFSLPVTAHRDIDIFAAGSFEPLKQFDLYTRIVHSIRQSLPDIKASHCGIGREKKKIESLVKELELEDHLQLLGGKPHAELLQLMQRTRVFLHTSRYEGFSTVCLEALYAGAHVISFCYPLDHNVPHWHVVNSPEEMKAKAIEILQDPRTSHTPVMLYDMDESAKAVMGLYISNSGPKSKAVITETIRIS
ncbi:MAG: glycosyltransferase family 4 protein [Chitinophagaceae bacterium]|nr:glycosyltransferase family 4 protein [Chitinophagaceae bacterium]